MRRARDIGPMKPIFAILAVFALAGCVSEYHPVSAFPPTASRQQAFAYCVNEAINETTTAPGLIGALAVAPGRTEIQDACMMAHGWTRN